MASTHPRPGRCLIDDLGDGRGLNLALVTLDRLVEAGIVMYQSRLAETGEVVEPPSTMRQYTVDFFSKYFPKT